MGAPIPPGAPSTAYLLGRLGLVEARARALVAERRRSDTAPDDPFRGLYLSDEHVDRLLEGRAPAPLASPAEQDAQRRLEEAADSAEERGGPIRLRTLARRAGLSALEVELLLVALAPDLDGRLEGVYGYLNDDVTRRRPTIGLALELCGVPIGAPYARACFAASSPLVGPRLLLVEDQDRPFSSRSLRVPDRVTGHLLGDDVPEAAVGPALAQLPEAGLGQGKDLARLLAAEAPLVYLRHQPGASAVSLAADALATAGWPALLVDLDHLVPGEDPVEVVRLAGREGLLTGTALVAGPIEVLTGRAAGVGPPEGQAGPSPPDRGAAALRELARLSIRPRDAVDGPGPTVLYGRSPWEPAWTRETPLVIEVPAASAPDRTARWLSRLAGELDPAVDVADVVGPFRLSVEQVDRAAGVARSIARLDDGPVGADHLRAGARAQNAAGLERLARHVRPRVAWDDLILAGDTDQALRELAARARHRDLVLDEWGMRPGRGRGITALFSGDPGTGKTMSAEVVAGSLGVDLYTVNLATVVDKYVGETEKNLERIFTEADGVNAVLLFDEADAIFGKRSEVRDANDRYANIEVAYLLQRMETFDGVAILATNLSANVDEAFARRLDMVVNFPVPDVALRRALWDRCLGGRAPRADDLDLDFCAEAFELSGGNIRSIAVTAAYLAADEGRAITMVDLVRAVQREYRKLGRLVVPGEFGPYYAVVAGDG